MPACGSAADAHDLPVRFVESLVRLGRVYLKPVRHHRLRARHAATCEAATTAIPPHRAPCCKHARRFPAWVCAQVPYGARAGTRRSCLRGDHPCNATDARSVNLVNMRKELLHIDLAESAGVRDCARPPNVLHEDCRGTRMPESIELRNRQSAKVQAKSASFPDSRFASQVAQ